MQSNGILGLPPVFFPSILLSITVLTRQFSSFCGSTSFFVNFKLFLPRIFCLQPYCSTSSFVLQSIQVTLSILRHIYTSRKPPIFLYMSTFLIHVSDPYHTKASYQTCLFDFQILIQFFSLIPFFYRKSARLQITDFYDVLVRAYSRFQNIYLMAQPFLRIIII